MPILSLLFWKRANIDARVACGWASKSGCTAQGVAAGKSLLCPTYEGLQRPDVHEVNSGELEIDLLACVDR